jgi:hypothetical protein
MESLLSMTYGSFWRGLEDDFRTLIASGFEFPVIWSPLGPTATPGRSSVDHDSQGEGNFKRSRSAPQPSDDQLAQKSPNFSEGLQPGSARNVPPSPTDSVAPSKTPPERHALPQGSPSQGQPVLNPHAQRSPFPGASPRPEKRSAKGLQPGSACNVAPSPTDSVAPSKTPPEGDALSQGSPSQGQPGLNPHAQRPRFPGASPRPEKRSATTGQEPLEVSSSLMGRYDREELYEQVWAVPMQKLAKHYGISDVALAKSCRKLLIPLPGRGYWAKKAASQPVRPRPPLPLVQPSAPKLTDKRSRSHAHEVTTDDQLVQESPDLSMGLQPGSAFMGTPSPAKPISPSNVVLKRHALPGGSLSHGQLGLSAHSQKLELPGARLQFEKRSATTGQEPLGVSSALMGRYNRDELYKQVWAVPMQKLAKLYGISDVALAKSCRKLLIPLPGRGYWAKKAASQPVRPRPPLPLVQIRPTKATDQRPQSRIL